MCGRSQILLLWKHMQMHFRSIYFFYYLTFLSCSGKHTTRNMIILIILSNRSKQTCMLYEIYLFYLFSICSSNWNKLFWRSPCLSELNPFIFYMELTHLSSEAFIFKCPNRGINCILTAEVNPHSGHSNFQENYSSNSC